MKRYQVYLNPFSVSVLDDLERIIDISRSKQLRLVIDRVAEVLATILRAKEASQNKKDFLLDELAGFIDLNTSKKINFTDATTYVLYKDFAIDEIFTLDSDFKKMRLKTSF